MKFCNFEVKPGHGGAERSVTKSGYPLCDKSHVVLTLRVGRIRHQTVRGEL